MFHFYLFLLYLILIHLRGIRGKPMEASAKEELHKYGYLNSVNDNENEAQEALKIFQKSYGLSVTGKMNEETKELMSRPRCGRPDNFNQHSKTPKWNKKYVTYTIVNTSEFLPVDETRNVFEEMTNRWTNNVNLMIMEASNNEADIRIYFSPQDGKGKVLAYAYYPEVGDIYFDESEEWTINGTTESASHLYRWTVAHEMGHSLGLEHSEDQNTVMFPYYVKHISGVTIKDKNRLMKLYGGAPGLDKKILCTDISIDSMLHTPSQHHIIIKGRFYWTVNENGLQSGPFVLSNTFPAYTSKVEAAFSIKNVTYLLRDNILIKYDSRRISRKTLKAGIADLPSNIDATFYCPSEKSIYFFKGSVYYKLDTTKPAKSRLVINGKSISKDWEGLPNDVDAATLIDDTRLVYFVKDDQLYKYDLYSGKVEETLALKEFFGC